MDRSLLQGVAWNGALKLIGQSVAWASTLVVTRLLGAEDYGIFGLGVLFLGFVNMLTEFGIGTTVVTRPDLETRDFAELNTVSVMLGVCGALSTALLAPLAGLVFHKREVTGVVLVLSLTCVIGSLRSVPWGLMQRGLRFRRLAVYDAAQAVALAGFSVALAIAGFRYWTLVAAALAASILSSAVTVLRHPVPFARPNWTRLKSTLTFSRELVLGRLAWYAYMNADFVVAGRMLGTAQAGYYAFAWTTAHLVVDKVAQLVFQVTPGVLARVQESPALLRRYFTQIGGVMALVCWPLTIGVSLVAHDFVPLVLGARWAPAVFPLTVLAAYSSTWIILPLVGQIMVIVGEERFQRQNNLRQLFMMATAFAAGAHVRGIDGIALAWVIVHPVFAVWGLVRVLRRVELSAAAYVRDALLPALVGCAAMAVAVLALRWTVLATLPAAGQLAAEILAGAATYVGVQLTVFRTRLRVAQAAMRELRER